MQMSEQQVNALYGQTVQDQSGSKIGSIGQIWTDASGKPSWISVKTGMFGMRESMVPLQAARIGQDRLTVPFDKDMVQHAPHVDTKHHTPLSDMEVEELYAHYRLGPVPGTSTAQPGAEQTSQAKRSPAKQSSAKPGPSRAQEELIRSEERLQVGKESQPAGTARLRKYVVTDEAHVTVPVVHDEIRLEREPVTAQNRAGMPPINEDQREMELRAERPVVGKEQVPVERVRMTKDQVTEERAIDEPVRRERIEADFPDQGRRS